MDSVASCRSGCRIGPKQNPAAAALCSAGWIGWCPALPASAWPVSRDSHNFLQRAPASPVSPTCPMATASSSMQPCPAASTRGAACRARIAVHAQRRRHGQPPLPPPTCSWCHWRQQRLPACAASSSSACFASVSEMEGEQPVLSDLDVSEPEDSGTSTRGSDGSGGSLRRDQWRVPLPPHLHGKAPRKHWNANGRGWMEPCSRKACLWLRGFCSLA